MKIRACLLVAILALCFVHGPAAGAQVNKHFLRSYPRRGSERVNIHTSIGISYAEPLDNSALHKGISVSGSVFGIYSGSLELSDDRKTIIFTPSRLFYPGETVTVTLPSFLAQGESYTEPETMTFTTDYKPAPIGNYPETDLPKQMPQSIPDTGNLPKIYVTKNVKPSPGEIYFANIFDPNGIGYRIRVKTDGTISYAKRNPGGFCTDYKANPNGTTSWVDYWEGHAFITDPSNNVVDSVAGANGFHIDIHEFQFNREGHFVIIADDNIDSNMSLVIPGGNTHATITFPVIQEFDKTHHLVFQWDTKDYFNIFDGSHENFQASSIDFSHMNSLDFDADSNIIASNRNMDEVTKINRQTGDIIWRMGGNNNQFTFLKDAYGFSGQHHFRRIANGNFTGFDDGNFRPGPYPFSRAVEYTLDQENYTATKVWDFRHIPDRFASGMGSVQRLPNGNTLIGWGFADTVGATEVDSLGNTVFELNFGTGTHSYRVYKFDTNYIFTNITEGLIAASDVSFGQVQVGDTIWKPILIRNTGLSSFTLQSYQLRTYGNDFTLDPSIKFPLTVEAGGSVNISLGFHPLAVQMYYDTISWTTDIPDQSKPSIKNKSFFVGEGTAKNAVSEAPGENTFTVYPNPVSGNYLNIITSTPYMKAQIGVYDVLGKEVYAKEVSGGTEFPIPVQDLAEGIYTIRFTLPEGTLVKRFSKLK